MPGTTERRSPFTLEQQQAVFLKIPGAVLKQLQTQSFFQPMMEAIVPLFLEWDILGSRYEAMIDLLVGEPSSVASYPLYEGVRQRLEQLQAEGRVPDAASFSALASALIDETQQNIFPDDQRSFRTILEVVLNRYFNESPAVPARSADNIEKEKEAKRQAFFARFAGNRDAYIAHQREMSGRAARVRREKAEELADAVIPLILQYVTEGYTYDKIAIMLNDLGLRTSRGLVYTRERIDDALAGQGNISREAARIRNQELLAVVEPIIEEMLAENATYPQIAEHLNNLGHKPPSGAVFTQDIVRFMVRSSSLTSPVERRLQRHGELKDELYRLFDALPADSTSETKKSIQRIHQLRNQLGLAIFRNEFSDHVNYSYAFTEVRWHAPLFLPVAALVTEQVIEWAGYQTGDDFDVKITSLSAAAEALITFHPLNGSIPKVAMYEEVSEVLSMMFDLFHHPFAEYLRPEQLKQYLISEKKHILIALPEPIPQQEFKPQGTGVAIPIAEMQRIFDEGKTKDEVATALSQKYGITIKVSAMSVLLDRGVLVYTRQREIDANLEQEERPVFESIRMVEETQRQVQEILEEVPFADLSESQREQWLQVVNFPNTVRSSANVFQRMYVKHGGSVQVLRTALEEGVLPARSFALLVGERFRADLYFHLAEKIWQTVEKQYGISPEYVAVEGHQPSERVGIMLVGDFVQQMAEVLIGEARSAIHLYQNQGDFYHELADRLTAVFTLGVHPFATVVNRAGLLVGLKDGLIHQKIMTPSTLWKIPFEREDGAIASVEDIIFNIVQQHSEDQTWPRETEEKVLLIEKELREQIADAVALTDENLTVEHLIAYLQKYQDKLLIKLKNLQKNV